MKKITHKRVSFIRAEIYDYAYRIAQSGAYGKDVFGNLFSDLVIQVKTNNFDYQAKIKIDTGIHFIGIYNEMDALVSGEYFNPSVILDILRTNIRNRP